MKESKEEKPEILRDIVYHPDYSHAKVSLDVYKPKSKNDGKLVPVIVYAHGGGWQRGDKSIKKFASNVNVRFAETMASQGYVVVMVNYRLSRIPHIYRTPIIASMLTLFFSVLWCVGCLLFNVIVFGDPQVALRYEFVLGIFAVLFCLFWGLNSYVEKDHQKERVKHPTHVLDFAHAYKYALDHVEEWGGDPKQIFLSGHSAGGHIVSLFSLNPSYLEQAGYSTNLIKAVKGVIPISAVLHLGRLNKHFLPRYFYLVPSFGSDRETYFEASPITYAAKKDNKIHFPFLLINASSDFHLTRDSKEMAAFLNAAGNEATCHVIPNTNHRSHLGNMGTSKDKITELVVDFIEKNKNRSLDQEADKSK